ncbi:MAG: membrane protein insertion efficiency factor YidD [Melioribacter sp.]|nr:membrane protein insertion efficiency factor YidD [Melioribacter sp.]
MKYILLLIFSSIIYSQTDWTKWDSVKVSYEIKSPKKIEKNSKKDFFEYAKKIYKFLISDLDGDNCSFTPTCSEFFIEAIRTTNVLTGTLIFSDRFIRDLNPFKISLNYSIINGKFYDPVSNYLLDSKQIKID